MSCDEAGAEPPCLIPEGWVWVCLLMLRSGHVWSLSALNLLVWQRGELVNKIIMCKHQETKNRHVIANRTVLPLHPKPTTNKNPSRLQHRRVRIHTGTPTPAPVTPAPMPMDAIGGGGSGSGSNGSDAPDGPDTVVDPPTPTPAPLAEVMMSCENIHVMVEDAEEFDGDYIMVRRI